MNRLRLINKYRMSNDGYLIEKGNKIEFSLVIIWIKVDTFNINYYYRNNNYITICDEFLDILSLYILKEYQTLKSRGSLIPTSIPFLPPNFQKILYLHTYPTIESET